MHSYHHARNQNAISVTKPWKNFSKYFMNHVSGSCERFMQHRVASGTIMSMIELSVVTISSNKTDAQVDMIHTCSDHLFEMANYQYTF